MSFCRPRQTPHDSTVRAGRKTERQRRGAPFPASLRQAAASAGSCNCPQNQAVKLALVCVAIFVAQLSTAFCMKLCLFGISGIPMGKHNIKDPRLDQAHQLVEAQQKTYAQADIVGEKDMITADAILTARAALGDLLMKDLDAVETRLGRDPGDAEKAVLQKLADVLMSEQPISTARLGADEAAA